VFAKAKGCKVWDPEGREYIDFLSAYSAVNQGHCHPKIVEALVNQASTLTLSSRAFYNNQFGQYAKFITEMFAYESVLPMNTGAEAVETAIKLARKWSYQKKGVAENRSIVLAATNNFHGRTIAIVSMSTDPDCRKEFGPFLERVGPVCPKSNRVVEYGSIKDLEDTFVQHGCDIAALLIEPIQGEAGIVVPPEGYMKQAYDLCKKHNALFIADEIQTGLGRTGKLLAIEHEGIRPDIVILGKALSGGVLPVSCILADKDIMLCIKPGEHGSTYGGNPLGSAVAVAALQVLKDDGMIENAARLGELFRAEMSKIKSPILKLVRGRGLLNAIVIDDKHEALVKDHKTAFDLCLLMARNGILAKPTHGNIIRLAPPLCITEPELLQAVKVIEASLAELMTIPASDIPHRGA